MSMPLDPATYLDHPEKAIALLNAVMASGGSLDAIENALTIVGLALARAGYTRPRANRGRRALEPAP
jgi:hypothetical protein